MNFKELRSQSPSAYHDALNNVAHSLFSIMLTRNQRSGYVRFSAISAEMKGALPPESDLTELARQLSSVMIVSEAIEHGSVVEITFPLFVMSKINKQDQLICIELNPTLVDILHPTQGNQQLNINKNH